MREERGSTRVRLASEGCADRNHRCASRVDGFDDLGVVDALEVDGGDAEVAVAELALDDDQRDAFAGDLDACSISQRRAALTTRERGFASPAGE